MFLWDSGSTVGEISGMTKRVNSVDFKPCRPYRIVAGSEDFTVSLYEAGGGGEQSEKTRLTRWIERRNGFK